MGSLIKNFGIVIIVTILVFSCARPVAPNGGPDDTKPPLIIREKSTPNFQTNFDQRIITLEFNEWVELSNPIKEILISPPTEFFPNYKIKGKKLIVEFNENEVLKEDVTYQINFGNAIKDFTVGNILKNERFVFSTGDKIDSLRLSGRVYDPITQEPKENIAVLLYDNLSDTAFSTQKPFYFIYTDKTGNFKFENIKQDSFNIYALEDLNNDYYYSAASEKISFYDSVVVLNDSFGDFIQLDLFLEEPELELVKKEKKKHGLVNFIFNKKLNSAIQIQSEIPNYQEIQNDSINFWYKPGELDSIRLIVPDLDSSWYKIPKKDTTTQKLKLLANYNARSFFYKDTFNYSSVWPISSIEVDSIKLIDTLGEAFIDTVYYEGREIKIVANLKQSAFYEINFLPNAVLDWDNNSNDSLSFKLNTGGEDDFGNLQLSFKGKKDSIGYIVELYQKEKLISSNSLQDTVILYEHMPIGKYNLKIIFDNNKNGKWDTGNLAKKTRPESIVDHQLEELKKGWDIEANIQLGEEKSPIEELENEAPRDSTIRRR